MIAVNELTSQKSTNRRAMETVTRLTAPFAPHIAEEFWHRLGNDGSVADAENGRLSMNPPWWRTL